MEIVVERDIRNELLGRREIEFTVRFDGPTPSRAQILGKLAAMLNAKENQVALDSLKTSFGMTSCKGKARIYDTEEQRNRTERAFLLSRGMPKQKEGEA